jgi:hypothetical protein
LSRLLKLAESFRARLEHYQRHAAAALFRVTEAGAVSWMRCCRAAVDLEAELARLGLAGDSPTQVAGASLDRVGAVKGLRGLLLQMRGEDVSRWGEDASHSGVWAVPIGSRELPNLGPWGGQLRELVSDLLCLPALCEQNVPGQGQGAATTRDPAPGPAAPSSATPAASGQPEPDGPFGVDGFRLRGIEVRFSRAAKQQALVLALWDKAKRCPRPARPIEDVLDEVYGKEHSTEDSTFRQLCADTRRRFESANLPLVLENLQGQVSLKPRPA